MLAPARSLRRRSLAAALGLRARRRPAPVPPSAAPTPAAPSTRALLRRAAAFVAPFRRSVGGILAIALLLAGANAAEPLVLRALFDRLTTRAPAAAMVEVVVLLLALELGRAALTATLSARTWRVRLGLDLAMRERVVRKLLALPVSFHQTTNVGGTITTVNQSLSSVVAAFGEVAFNVLPTLVYFALSLVAMWHLSPALCAVVLVFAPLPAIVGALASPAQTVRERRLLAHWEQLYGRLGEVLGGVRAVKLFARERAEADRFVAGQRDGNAIVASGVRTDARMDALRGLASTLARLAALGAGGTLVLRGELSVGTLVAFLGYINGLFGPVQGLTTVYQTLRRAGVALENVFRVLDADELVHDREHAVEAPPLAGAVRFEGVSFAYDAGRPVLHDVSLDIQPGETVALVGPSGSGKTTLVQLLQRLHPLRDGSIRVDGHDVRDLRRDSLCRQIGTVFQDAYLFQDTIRANIAYGRPDATDAEIEAAARAANALDFIRGFPDGFQTNVGERGSRLSGGQRQRLAIARALLVDPPILILDEATSALDAESEALVQEALARLTRGRTTIVIAHRLATVVDADRVVVLREGRIVESGTHQWLMRAGGYYASLVARQTDGLLAA